MGSHVHIRTIHKNIPDILEQSRRMCLSRLWLRSQRKSTQLAVLHRSNSREYTAASCQVNSAVVRLPPRKQSCAFKHFLLPGGVWPPREGSTESRVRAHNQSQVRDTDNTEPAPVDVRHAARKHMELHKQIIIIKRQIHVLNPLRLRTFVRIWID